MYREAAGISSHNPKSNPPTIVPHHPPEKLLPEIPDGIFQATCFTKVVNENRFYPTLFPHHSLQGTQEKKAVGGLEGTVHETGKPVALFFCTVVQEFIRRPFHQIHQPESIPDNGFSLPPGQDSGKECGDFNIMRIRKTMGDTNGIGANKTRMIMFRGFGFRKIKLLILIHAAPLS